MTAEYIQCCMQPNKMADVKVSGKNMSRSGSVMSQISVDAEPILNDYSNNYYSGDLSQDAIAGVPPRSTGRVGTYPVQPRQQEAPRLVLGGTQAPVQFTVQPPRRQASGGSPGTDIVTDSKRSSVQEDELSVRNSRTRQVSTEKNFKDEDGDSSYGSYMSSMESSSSLSSPDWEAELEEYKEKMPTEVRESYYDAVILYTEKDREKAVAFQQHLINEIHLPHNETVRAVLYDGPELTALSGSQIQHLDLAMERSTYVFVYLTKNFVKDKWCEFSSESCLMRAIYDEEKRWCVVPVYTRRRTDCKFKIPMGLNSLKGINFYSNDEFYRKGVSRLIGDKLSVRKRLQEEHKIKQKTWLENHKRELIRVEEQKRRIAQQENKMTHDLLRKVGQLPDSDLFPNQEAKMHPSFSDSNFYSHGNSVPHSASAGNMKMLEQHPAVAQYFSELLRQNKQGQQGSYTQEQIQQISQLPVFREPAEFSPAEVTGKFQRLDIQSGNSNCSADMGIQSEEHEAHGELELRISPEQLAFLETLNSDQQQEYIYSMHAKQQEQEMRPSRDGTNQEFADPASLGSYLPSGPRTIQSQNGSHTNGIPNLDMLSIRSQQSNMENQLHSYNSEMSGVSAESSGNYSGGSSLGARPEMSNHRQRTMEPSQGNIPTRLFDDGGSIVSEDGRSLVAQDGGWTMVDREEVPQLMYNRAEKQEKKDGKRRKQTPEPIEMKETTKTNQQGQIVHQTIYHIYNPRAVQIGDENVVQDGSEKIQEEDSGAESDETAHKEKSAVDKSTKKEETAEKKEKSTSDKNINMKGKEIHPEEEMDSIENMRPLDKNVPGEMSDDRHNSGLTVAMDAALSSTGSNSHMPSELPVAGQVEYKNDLSTIREVQAPSTPVKQNQKMQMSELPRTRLVTRGPKPELPTKPLPYRHNATNKLEDDTDQTMEKPSKIVLPVKPFSNNDCSDQSDKSPSIMKTVFAKPIAKVGPSILKNNNEEENTDPKTVIDSQETALKRPCTGNRCEETRVKTVEASSGVEIGNRIVQHESKRTVVDKSPPRRSIQSLMPLDALERRGPLVNTEVRNTELRKETSHGDNKYQAAPFSISRYSDASTLFYRNRFDAEPDETAKQNNMDSIDESEVNTHSLGVFDQSETSFNQGLYCQEIPLGEDPLTRAQGRKNPSLLVKDHGTEV